jgi:hypothetical protein
MLGAAYTNLINYEKNLDIYCTALISDITTSQYITIAVLKTISVNINHIVGQVNRLE